MLVDLQPRLIGKLEVEQDDIRRPLGDATDPLCARRGHIRRVLRGSEGAADLRQDPVWVVVDEQELAQGAPRRPARLERLAEPHPPVRGAMTRSIPQDRRDPRRVLPSARSRLTRLGRDGTVWPTIYRRDPREPPARPLRYQAGPWGARTVTLVPVPAAGPGRRRGVRTRRIRSPRRDRTRPAALVCDLRTGWNGDRTTHHHGS